MENRNGKNTWKSVPEFGGWDRKDPSATDYSMVFSQARADRKHKKTTINRASLGNEQELNVRRHPDPVVVGIPEFVLVHIPLANAHGSLLSEYALGSNKMSLPQFDYMKT